MMIDAGACSDISDDVYGDDDGEQADYW